VLWIMKPVWLLWLIADSKIVRERNFPLQ
jgi:hypothetical protein